MSARWAACNRGAPARSSRISDSGFGAGEEYISPPGDVRAYDVVTGKLVWQFHTVPHPGEPNYDAFPKDAWKYIGGINTWGDLTIDAKNGIAFFPLGSPTYDFYGADRKGANLYGNCLLALDARTGKYLWHFQTVHHDLWDYDLTSAPQLTTIKRDGKEVEVVAAAGKTGFLYVFERKTGKPIWPIEERKVPQTDVAGEHSWPTQPFPTAPPPFARRISRRRHQSFSARRTARPHQGPALDLAERRPVHAADTAGHGSVAGDQGGSNWGTTAAESDERDGVRAEHRCTGRHHLDKSAPGIPAPNARLVHGTPRRWRGGGRGHSRQPSPDAPSTRRIVRPVMGPI